MKVISVVNMKGGVAKTTLAINIADALARREEYSVLLIDTDPQFNATQCLINPEEYLDILDNNHTIVDIFEDDSRVITSPVKGKIIREPVEIEEIIPTTIKENFDLIPGNLDLYRLESHTTHGREARIQRYIEYLSENDMYDFVIIDTPPTPSVWMISSLFASDCYLIPVKPEPISTTGIDLLKGVVERAISNSGIDINCLGVVLTIAESNTINYKNTIKFLDNNPTWSGKRFSASLLKRTVVAREQANQKLILDLDDSSVKLSLTKITTELLQRINDEQ